MYLDGNPSPYERVCWLDVLGCHSCQPLFANYKSRCLFQDAHQEKPNRYHYFNLDLCFHSINSSYKWGTTSINQIPFAKSEISQKYFIVSIVARCLCLQLQARNMWLPFKGQTSVRNLLLWHRILYAYHFISCQLYHGLDSHQEVQTIDE
jgi:hypothetical protein